ncbi:alpha and gamma adaptin binding protein p34-like [Metarhizium robertsii]|uniref:Alpha and gamma adaptin binding protein p34-like n=1 Tax=Metarhizium robertsii TaxID=568076 RepID=A0A014P4T8_9HYPO|nr:alpha and gamma adaptin binding protein p34-like [Metarhizium robertsii]
MRLFCCISCWWLAARTSETHDVGSSPTIHGQPRPASNFNPPSPITITMDVAHPRRILAVSLDSQADQLSRVIKDLTGSSPCSPSPSLAGTTHNLSLKTQYYTATVPIWLDLIASPSDWSASFLSDEAAEVLAVLGGLVLIFSLPPSASSESIDRVRDVIHHVGHVVNNGLGGWEWDGVRLAVGVGDSDAQEWDELCAEAGLEFVQIGGKQLHLNEFGGISRVKEALESNDWAQDAPSDFGDFEDASDGGEGGHLDPESLDFGFDRADFEGLKKAIWEARPGDQEPSAPAAGSGAASKAEADNQGDIQDELGHEDVDKVESMMRKLQAVRDAGEGLPEAQRKRMAARAVGEVMKEL